MPVSMKMTAISVAVAAVAVAYLSAPTFDCEAAMREAMERSAEPLPSGPARRYAAGPVEPLACD